MSKPGQFLLYTAPSGAVKVDVFIQQETVWLTQKALAELFGVNVPAVNKHLKNIFDSGELIENSVISILETTAADGKNYSTRYYNLDAIIAVGYGIGVGQRGIDIQVRHRAGEVDVINHINPIEDKHLQSIGSRQTKLRQRRRATSLISHQGRVEMRTKNAINGFGKTVYVIGQHHGIDIERNHKRIAV